MGMTKCKNVLAMLLVSVLLFATLCTMTSCRANEAEESTEDAKNTEMIQGDDGEYEDPAVRGSIPADKPALVVEGVKAKAGDKRVQVVIDVVNNPGILGMDYDLYYDDSVMTLVEAQSVPTYEGCVFTSPAYYKNPTTFLWDSQDANWFEDGELLKLYFDIAEDAAAGKYELKIMYSYGNIVDAEGEPIDFGVKNGYISIS